MQFRPDGALQSFVGASVVGMHMGEKVEVGVAGNFGMSEEKLCQLRIVVGYVVLIGEQRWVMRYDGGEHGAQTQQPDELLLRDGQVAVAHRGLWRWSDCGGPCRSRWTGGYRRSLSGSQGGAQDGWDGQRTKKPGQAANRFRHFGFPSFGRAL